MKEDIQVKNNEAQREMRKKEKMEREFKESKSEAETKSLELKSKQIQLQRAQEETLRIEQQLKEQRVRVWYFFGNTLKPRNNLCIQKNTVFCHIVNIFT